MLPDKWRTTKAYFPCKMLSSCLCHAPGKKMHDKPFVVHFSDLCRVPTAHGKVFVSGSDGS
jgi:hypothetical protein